MPSSQMRAQLDACLALLKEKQDSAARRREITDIVQNVLHSLSGDVSARDIRLYEELESLAKYIREAKTEIATLKPADISEEHIPLATDELDAIVAHTEEATGTILDCAEKIEEVAKDIDKAAAAALEECVTRIYEACNFQDITGQRNNKVVKTLKHIEERVNNVVVALGHEEGAAPEAKKKTEPSSQEVNDSDLLNGPQMPEEAFSQDDIDALLAD